MNKKTPTHIRVSNLERTLNMIESMAEEIEDEKTREGAFLAIKLIRKQYGLEKEKGRE